MRTGKKSEQEVWELNLEVGSVIQKQGDVIWAKVMAMEMNRGSFIQEIGNIIWRTW